MAAKRKGELRRSRPLTVHFTERERDDLAAAAEEVGKPAATLVHDLVQAMLWDRAQQALDASLERDAASESWRQARGLE